MVDELHYGEKTAADLNETSVMAQMTYSDPFSPPCSLTHPFAGTWVMRLIRLT